MPPPGWPGTGSPATSRPAPPEPAGDLDGPARTAAAHSQPAGSCRRVHQRPGRVAFCNHGVRARARDLVGGLPGTGKIALAGALADCLGFTVLSSDRIRKELAGVPAEQRCGAPWRAGIYTAARTERVYSELLSRAGRLLALGESVIADASFTSPAQRAAAAAAAAAAHADLVQLRCTAPAEAVRQRLAARTGGISDADEKIARQMAALDVPWPEAVTVDTGQPAVVPGELPDAVVKQALEVIRPRQPEHVRRPGRPVLVPG